MRHRLALLFLGASLFGAFRFFIYTHVGQQVDEQAYAEYANQFLNYRGPTLTALDSLPTIVGVVAVLGLIAVLVWKHRFLPALVGVLCMWTGLGRIQWAVALLAAIATCLTGASTIINGWHRPVDVVTAILVTSMWTVLGMALLRYVRRGDFTIASRGGLVLVPLLTIATCMNVAVSFGTTALTVNLLRARNNKRQM